MTVLYGVVTFLRGGNPFTGWPEETAKLWNQVTPIHCFTGPLLFYGPPIVLRGSHCFTGGQLVNVKGGGILYGVRPVVRWRRYWVEHPVFSGRHPVYRVLFVKSERFPEQP